MAEGWERGHLARMNFAIKIFQFSAKL